MYIKLRHGGWLNIGDFIKIPQVFLGVLQLIYRYNNYSIN